MLLAAGLNGFVLGVTLIVAIGAQNAFVLRQGLRREFVLAVCLVCAISDALLIAAGVAGMGTLVRQSPLLLGAATIGGAAFLFLYGLGAFIRAAGPRTLTPEESRGGSLLSTIGVCLALTFLNPHVYLDTVVLLGSLSARFSGADRWAYGAGAGVASFAWFFSLGYGARLLAPVFAKPVAWRVLDVAIGLVMWGMATGLMVAFSSREM
jgi:L-lysine exporter family protein LysE/ArgO